MTQQGIISSLSVFDYANNKLCDLYDSQNDLTGQAYKISFTRNITDGIKSLSFCIPYMVEEEKNFRWDYLKSEYLIRLVYNGETEWYIAQKPTKHKSKDEVYGEVTCSGLEATLKTKNIYMEFDDENGIGTLSDLADKVLAGTGWHRGYTDPMLEKDGETEKIRSISNGNKTGALGLLTTLCNIFMCFPIYKTDTKTVEFYNFNNRDQVLEGSVGYNLDALSVSYNSSDIITRLYVEGEYADDGYIGIDDVNPTGLSYIMNFDYYREIGVFKEVHEQALSTYLTDIAEINTQIKQNTTRITEESDAVNKLIGQCDLVLYYASSGWTTPVEVYGSPTTASQVLAVGDKVIVLNSNGTYRTETITTTPGALIRSGDYGIAKFITGAAGSIGAYEIQIEAKEKEIENLQRKLNATANAEKKAEYRASIYALQDEIEYIYLGADASGNIKDTLGSKYVPSGYDGNVDLINRIIVPNSVMVRAWPKFSDTYATLYPQTYTAGTTSGYKYSYTTNEVINVTPIKNDGTVLTKNQLESYLSSIIAAAKADGTSIKIKDNYGLLLSETAVPSGTKLADAKTDALAWCTVLNGYQSQWDTTRARYNWFGDGNTYDPYKVFGNTNNELVGLYAQMDALMRSSGHLHKLGEYNSTAASLRYAQDEIESDFIIAMGDMLHDGYWNNQNYVQGQEQQLFDDANERLDIMSRPSVTYSFNLVRLMKEFGIPLEDFKLNGIFKITDDELDINDNLFITKITIGVDDESDGDIEVTNKDITLNSNDLGALLSRMSQLADLIEQKNTLYERAQAITKNKTLYADRLNGQIDVVKNQILSSVSNWHTDDSGNIIFISADETSAMMLSGAGLLIASSKDDNGEWNWRTAATGEGITADEIVAGFISAERIEAGSIATSKLEPDAGNSLIITGNPSITALNDQIAPAFVVGQAYEKGQLVSNDETCYVFTDDYAGGSFVNAPVQPTSVATQIELLPDQIIQYVGQQGYSKTYIQLTDPTLDPSNIVTTGDYWVLGQDLKIWNELNQGNWSSARSSAWGTYTGLRQVYCMDHNGNWVRVSDMSQVAEAFTQITQNRYEIRQEALRANAAEGELTSLISQTADKITQEVARATASEGKLSSNVTQTADKLSAEVTRATNAENSKIAKTTQYQTADSIVSSAKTYTDGQLTSYSTTTQTSELISAYVTSNAYQKVSGITITASGVSISGSQYVKIAAGGYLQVETSTFVLNTNKAYCMLAGSTDADTAPFYLKRDGTIKATLGKIAGWTIGSNYIGNAATRANATIGLNSEATGTAYAIWSGGKFSATPKFSVTAAGAMTATNGNIGGWTIGSDYLGNKSTKAASTIGMNSAATGTDIAIWAGDTFSSTAGPNFYVKADGTLHAKTGSFEGTIYATNLSGSIVTSQISNGAVTYQKGSSGVQSSLDNGDSANDKLTDLFAGSLTAAYLKATRVYGSGGINLTGYWLHRNQLTIDGVPYNLVGWSSTY